MFKYIYLSLILGMLIFGTIFAEQSSVSSDHGDSKEIEQVVDSYYDAWNKHDARRMASYYANDGDLRTPWNEKGNNRTEIEKIFKSQQENQMKNAQIAHSINTIKMIKPDIAYVDVDSHITGMQTSQAKQYAPLHHHVAFVLVKRDGKWQVLIGRPF